MRFIVGLVQVHRRRKEDSEHSANSMLYGQIEGGEHDGALGFNWKEHRVTDISVLKSVKIGTHSVYLYNKEIV